MPPTGSAEDGTLALEGQAADAMRASASTHGPIGRDREPDTILGVRVPHQVRVWLVPFGVLALSAGAVFYCGYCLDKARQKDAPGLWHLLSTVSNGSAQNMLGSVGEVTSQILGVAISVVAIIVELASTRYTHRITELFFREPVNFAVMGLFVISGINGLWVQLLLHDDFNAPSSTLLAMVLMTVSALLLLPYFSYVFDFLNPMNVVGRIRDVTLRAIRVAERRSSRVALRLESLQRDAANGAEQLADIVLNAMANHDGTIAIASVNALGELGRDYVEVKGALPPDWFRIPETVSQNPDFVSMSQEMLDQLGREESWFEFKLLRQFQAIYQAGLGGNRELCYVVAIHTRELAEHAMARGNPQVVDLCVKFFNTYLRSTVNGRDVRTAYNVFNQYRLLAEAALRKKQGRFAVEVARYFKYYGQLAFHMDLGFVLETAAYDLCALNELAFDLKAPERLQLLRIFLEVDKEGEGATREASLKGVRKAQVKLATYYLLRGDAASAREVFRDMRHEQPARLAAIRDEMLSIGSPYFWEITDRGTNFDYIPPDRKQRLLEFFSWFGDSIPSPRASLTPVEPSAPTPAEPADILVLAPIAPDPPSH